MKPQPRGRHPTVPVPVKKTETLVEQSHTGASLQPALVHSTTLTGSDGSVSPEALSEALMGPPPVRIYAIVNWYSA